MKSLKKCKKCLSYCVPCTGHSDFLKNSNNSGLDEKIKILEKSKIFFFLDFFEEFKKCKKMFIILCTVYWARGFFWRIEIIRALTKKSKFWRNQNYFFFGFFEEFKKMQKNVYHTVYRVLGTGIFWRIEIIRALTKKSKFWRNQKIFFFWIFLKNSKNAKKCLSYCVPCTGHGDFLKNSNNSGLDEKIKILEKSKNAGGFGLVLRRNMNFTQSCTCWFVHLLCHCVSSCGLPWQKNRLHREKGRKEEEKSLKFVLAVLRNKS